MLMHKITELSLELLQTTQMLHDTALIGELLSLEELQQQRAKLVAELDLESRQPYPQDVLTACRDLLEQSRVLEAKVAKILQEKRDAIGREHDQLQRNQQARKAYGSFS